uniref:RxLR effector protein n=1 Tax=Globisporangium ultimum (strain ATCC 200006 / CBS 805.95 / DAOM BR144) TaxID=431595 RepID=K3W820_GLOUD
MCPLRYILLLLSLLVAMIGLSQAMSEQEMSAVTNGDEDDEKEASQQQQKTTFRTLVDMLNGKYLYDAYKASQMRIKAE